VAEEGGKRATGHSIGFACSRDYNSTALVSSPDTAVVVAAVAVAAADLAGQKRMEFDRSEAALVGWEVDRERN
jgi:hypothetical protein